ncbi:hypothetical protein [Bacteroides sp. 51]|uniref:hypothetical protein n=1 Tax=Bacteroides sp. 51 TaxID=2302938 RepID=UPI0013D38862|nr:hypothetical protein [Bacteroides sp. 51]NDV83146.1 hypothetical protein [Bacteroides sp. 51]
MASINPKLEFFRFKLNPRQEEFKTFRDFAIDELKGKTSFTDDKIMKSLFTHFIKSLDGNYSKDDKMKKQIKLEKRSAINKYLINQPKYLSESNVLLGVINGGSYGRHRIIGDITNPEEGSQLGKNKTVLQYYYFLLYLPLDHNEGCFVIHSNGKEETITNIFRSFISHLFKGTKYNKVVVESFCPKSFQDEFRKGAIIQTIEFKDSKVDNTHTANGTSDIVGKYNIRIEVSPENKNISITAFDKLKSTFASYIFGKEKLHKKLHDFDEAKVVTKNPVDNSTRTFEWNTKDKDFVPVVYLDGRIAKQNDDGTPDFDELEKLCKNYFNDEVLPELRPDLNVSKAK